MGNPAQRHSPKKCAKLSPLGFTTLGFLLFCCGHSALLDDWGSLHAEPVDRGIPKSWRVLPIPSYVDYGSSDETLALGRVAIVRKESGPYQTIRGEDGELAGGSTITEEELTEVLQESGVSTVEHVADNLPDYNGFDTLILLGSPQRNRQTARILETMKLGFDRWDNPNTPEDDFTEWRDFGREGYLLKVGRCSGQNVVILAGYDFDDAKDRFYSAGTFYALHSLRQLLVSAHGRVEIKTAEIADKPLVAYRACMMGYRPDQEENWRDVRFLVELKANQNNYWYGNSVGGYSAEAAAQFRYPWRSENLDFFKAIGKYCRERYVTMVFCLNPDHFGIDWAAPKTFDGNQKDPVHYDPDYRVEAPLREMWAELGYTMENDIDAVAAKFAQINKAVGVGAMLTMMNEDDPYYGLVHEADRKLFKTETGDTVKDAVNYGRARGLFLTRLYRRIRQMAPDSIEPVENTSR